MSWPLVAIKDVAKVVTGKTPSKLEDDNFGGEIPFVTPAELDGSVYVSESQQTITKKGASKLKLVPQNAVMVCCIGSLGKLAIANKTVATNQQINSVIFDERKIYPKYGYYSLSRLKPIMETLAPSTTVAIINKSKFESLEIPLPPLTEQKRIAAILDKADAIRRKRQQAIQLADEFLRAVFLDMFGDPVTNPKGWEMVTLGDVIQFAKDGPHVSPSYSDDGIPFLSTRHVKPSGVVWEDLKFVTHEEAELHWKKCKPSLGDILYTKGGTTGIACPVDFEEEFAVWVHVALLRPIARKVNYIWLSHMLNSKYCYVQSQRLTRGATNKDLGLTRMTDIRMFCPPLRDQERFAEIKRKIDGFIRTNEMFGQYRLFESFSKKAFSGDF